MIKHYGDEHNIKNERNALSQIVGCYRTGPTLFFQQDGVDQVKVEIPGIYRCSMDKFRKIVEGLEKQLEHEKTFHKFPKVEIDSYEEFLRTIKMNIIKGMTIFCTRRYNNIKITKSDVCFKIFHSINEFKRHDKRDHDYQDSTKQGIISIFTN